MLTKRNQLLNVANHHTGSEYKLVAATGLSVDRQTQTHELSLSPGCYVVVPLSSGCRLLQALLHHEDTKRTAALHKQSLAANSLLSLSRSIDTTTPPSFSTSATAAAATYRTITSSSRLRPKNIPDFALLLHGDKEPIVTFEAHTQELVFTAKAKKALDGIFDRFDIDHDGCWGVYELDLYSIVTDGCPLEKGIFEWLTGQFETRRDIGLTKRGFKQSQLYLVEQILKENEFTFLGQLKHTSLPLDHISELEVDINNCLTPFRADLVKLGYDGDTLELCRGRPAALVVHSDVEFELQQISFDPRLWEEAMELPVKETGTRQVGDGRS